MWLSLYDESTGRLAINDDAQSGLAFYKLDDLLAGKTEQVGFVKTEGPVSAAVIKPYKDRRLLVVCGRNESAIHFHDAESLAEVGKVDLKNDCYVRTLAASESVGDRFVFYALGGKIEEKERLARGAELPMGNRIDLETMQRDPSFRLNDNDPVNGAAISPDGRFLYHRAPLSPSGKNVVFWQGVRYDNAPAGRLTDEHRDVSDYRLSPFGNFVAADRYVTTADMFGEEPYQTFDYDLMAYFRKLPYVVGMRFNEFVLASANDYRELTMIALPAEWFPPRDWQQRDELRRSEPGDFRRQLDIAMGDPMYLAVYADDARATGRCGARRALGFRAACKVELAQRADASGAYDGAAGGIRGRTDHDAASECQRRDA